MSIWDLLQNTVKKWLNIRVNSIIIDEGITYENGVFEDVNFLPASGNTSLVSSQSGKTYFIPTQTSNNIVSLPPVQQGVRFEFIVSGTPDNTHTLKIGPTGSGKIQGNCVGVASALEAIPATGKDYLILSGTGANVKPGNYVNIVSDGSNYFCYAFSSGTAQGWSMP